MNIGIVTFQIADNYGAMLQLYALQQNLKELGGVDTEVGILNYQPKFLKKAYDLNFDSSKFRKNGIKYLINYLINYKEKKSKRNKFDKFRCEYLKIGNQIIEQKSTHVNNEFDLIFYGSDQIWNPNITNGFDGFYFGDFKSEQNCIHCSYAASLGVSELNESNLKEFSNLLSNFTKISVREEQAKAIIDATTEYDSIVVVDPTFLVKKKDWINIEKREIEYSNYVLVYELESNQEMINYAIDLGRKMNCQVVVVKGSKKLRKNNCVEIVDCGPRELIGLINHSNYVVTNSFHGTTMSIILEKKFVTFTHTKVPSRMINLLGRLHLNERLNPNSLEICDKNIEFVNVREAIGEMVTNSNQYISQCIDLAKGNKIAD